MTFLAIYRARSFSLEQRDSINPMRYFFDTEFIEDGKTIELISIGMVCEDDRQYYAVKEDPRRQSKTLQGYLRTVIASLLAGYRDFYYPVLRHKLEPLRKKE